MLDTYDVVVEISRAKLLDYLLDNIAIQGLPIAPRFVLRASSPAGNVQAILDAVDLRLTVGADQVTLVYHVYGAAIELTGQDVIGFSEGAIEIALKLTTGAPVNGVLQSATFQTAQTADIPDPSAFLAAVDGILTGMLDTTTVWQLFPHSSNQAKLLMAKLGFGGQISCLDAETVVAAVGTGNIAQVTNFLTTEDFGIGLSAPWVKNNLLYPSEVTLLNPQDVATARGTSLAQATNDLQQQPPDPGFLAAVKPLLPAPFGSGSPKQSAHGVDVYFDFVDFTLANGVIKMTGTYHAEGTCVHVHSGAISEDISLSIDNQQLKTTFTPNPPQPTGSVAVDFWCAAGLLVVVAFVAQFWGIVVASILIGIVSSIAIKPNPLSATQSPIPLFDQVAWTRIETFAEGLVLLGVSSAVAAYETTLSSVNVAVTSVESKIEDIGSGPYHFPGTMVCHAQDFVYEEFRKDVTATLYPSGVELLYPVTTTWLVHGQAITGGSGQITYTDQAHTATPPFHEALLPNHQITIDYAINPGPIFRPNSRALNILRLTFPKSDYNVRVPVELSVQDASGHTYSWPLVLDTATDVAQFGQDFIEFQQQCALATKIWTSKLKTIPQGVRQGDDHLTVEDVTEIVKEVVNEQPQRAVAIVRDLNAIYGTQAILSAFSPPPNLKPQQKG